MPNTDDVLAQMRRMLDDDAPRITAADMTFDRLVAKTVRWIQWSAKRDFHDELAAFYQRQKPK